MRTLALESEKAGNTTQRSVAPQRKGVRQWLYNLAAPFRRGNRDHDGHREKPVSKWTLADAITAFERFGKAKNLSASTSAFYLRRLTAFKNYLEGHRISTTLKDITTDIVFDFLTYEIEQVSDVTAEDSYVTLQCLFNFLRKNGKLVNNPMENVERPKVKKKIIQTFTLAQIQRMREVCRDGFTGRRDDAIIMVLVDCGIRVSELCGIHLDDINWEEQTILVTGKGNKERITPFGSETRKSLAQYLEQRKKVTKSSVLFVTPDGASMNRQAVYRALKGCGIQAEIKKVRVSPHTFRHTCAVNDLRNGGDVFSLQKLLGHEDLTMTRRYVELAQQDVQAKHRLASPGDALARMS